MFLVVVLFQLYFSWNSVHSVMVMRLLVFQYFFVFAIQWHYWQTSQSLSELAWILERVVFPNQKTFHVEDATRTQQYSIMRHSYSIMAYA